MEGPRCVIKKCFAVKYGSRHCFPNPAKNMEMFKKWIKYCDDEIRSLPPENVYQNRRVCRNHFINDQFGSNNRLLSSAYPVLNIPMLSVPSAINNKITDNMTMQPTTFYNIEIEPSVGPSKESEMHIYASTPKRSGILADIDLTRQKDLTRKLYRKLNIEKRKTTALRRLTKSLKIRLRKADQYAKSKVFEKMYSKLGLIRTRFFESQLANANRASKGHRFSTKDKLFALALYKQTGRGYKFLSNIFDLPSKSTLTRLLQSIPVKPGLNTAILNVLNKKARYFKNPLEKYCILIFDEMSISPHLDFDQKEESIVGFESNGCQTSRLIANHVQVFMLQGIYRKWKQPVYYNFIKGASKSALIAKTIKEIIRAVENIGLQIIATVCDQATNNVAAINSLIDSTNYGHLYNNMQNLGFTYMLPRRFNQDGLENFFGRIRQCGMRYVNPTAFAFTPFYKSLLINNLTSKHPPGSNCEDDNTGILVTLEMLINQNQNEEAQTASQLFTVKKQQSRALSLTTVAYVVGFLMKKILPKYRSCGICKKNVCSSEEERTAIYHKLTQAKEYGAVAHKLQYISENLFIKMSHVYYVIRNILPDIIEKKNILTFLTQYCHENISFEFEQCNHTHSLIKNIIHGFTKIIVCNYIRHVNDILQGKDRRDIRKEADTIFHSAKEMYIKTKRH
ncbi:thap domain-containing protein 9 [Holotrichia oblita]|uniref:Thap domain-containing protein 9 n=1 Tax=Holotrichia oblita TaxID=644536 RepID=A0ACB9T8L4_HOLOL|nr:thap domain-containing protein 9 [Holotrichia oblita]